MSRRPRWGHTAAPLARHAGVAEGRPVERLEDRVCLGSILPGPGDAVAAVPPAVAEFDPAPAAEPAPAWFERAEGAVEVRYDFRDAAGRPNEMTPEQQALAEEVLRLWSEATGGRVRFT
ncbi:MAG TPA: hypothetical protein VF170_05785, partial [Planctomycetaceae bacterium]